MTQIEIARKRKYSQDMRIISKREAFDLETLRARVASGKIVIPHNKKRKIERLCGIGYGLTTKVNANLLQFMQALHKII